MVESAVAGSEMRFVEKSGSKHQCSCYLCLDEGWVLEWDSGWAIGC